MYRGATALHRYDGMSAQCLTKVLLSVDRTLRDLRDKDQVMEGVMDVHPEVFCHLL